MMAHDRIIPLYEQHARDFDRERSRALHEKAWLDRFIDMARPSGTVVDVGCGVGEPMARYLTTAGLHVVGVDSSSSMVAICRERFPRHEWVVADMRQLTLPRRFDGILAWDSFFHLRAEDQRLMFPRFARHAKRGAALMFTSGPRAGEAVGSYHGQPLYHASLDPAEYERLLAENGFVVRAYMGDDADCGGHSIWLAAWEAPAAA